MRALRVGVKIYAGLGALLLTIVLVAHGSMALENRGKVIQ